MGTELVLQRECLRDSSSDLGWPSPFWFIPRGKCQSNGDWSRRDIMVRECYNMPSSNFSHFLIIFCNAPFTIITYLTYILEVSFLTSMLFLNLFLNLGSWRMFGGKIPRKISIFLLSTQDMMQAIDHLEATCHNLWCSFSSSSGSLPHLVIFPNQIRFMKSLIIFSDLQNDIVISYTSFLSLRILALSEFLSYISSVFCTINFASPPFPYSSQSILCFSVYFLS